MPNHFIPQKNLIRFIDGAAHALGDRDFSLSGALAQFGAELCGRDRHPSLKSQADNTGAVLRAAWHTRFGAPVEDRTLPPLNQQLVT